MSGQPEPRDLMADPVGKPCTIAPSVGGNVYDRTETRCWHEHGLWHDIQPEHGGADLAAMRSLADCCERAGAFCGEGLYAEVVRLRERESALIRAKDADLDDVRDELDETKALVGQLQGQLDAVQAIVDESGGLLHDEGFGYVVRDLDAALAVAVLSDREGTQ